MGGRRPERVHHAYPDRVASRRVRDGGRSVAGGDQARRVVTRIDAEPLTGFVQVGVYGVLGNPQPPGDLLGAQVLIYKTQAFALARRQQINGRVAVFRKLPHRVHNSFTSTFLSMFCLPRLSARDPG
jgi:hypothetical protein